MSHGDPPGGSTFAVWAFAAAFAAIGCHHVIVPVGSEPLPVEEVRVFPPGTILRLENGHESPALLEIRTEGAHVLKADLREWTAKLLVELELELRRRGAEAIVSEDSVKGTSVILPEEGEVSGWDARAERRAFPVLRVRVSHLGDPSAGVEARPLVAAELESSDGAFASSCAAELGSRTYSTAFLSLKRRIIEDPRFRRWLLAWEP